MGEMKDIEIFTGPDCPYCDQAKALLKAHGLEFREHDVTAQPVMDDFRDRLPRARALPQVFIDGEHIGSLEDLRLKLT